MNFKNPYPTVDIIIWNQTDCELVLIERKNKPYGWALPGGFVDQGESLETAAIREAKEETNLKCELICQFHTYSDPNRDTRFHTISTVYIAHGEGELKGLDDAKEAKWFGLDQLPDLAFDHRKILMDFQMRYVQGNQTMFLNRQNNKIQD